MILLNILLYAVPIILIVATIWTGIVCANFYKKDVIESNK